MGECVTFYTIAIAATVGGGIMFLLSLLGIGDHDGDFHVDGDGAVEGDYGWISLKSIIGFMLGFGWGGYMAESAGLSSWGAIGVGALVGLFMFVIVALLMRFVMNLKSDGTLDYQTLIGMTGTVYVTIPPNRENGGQITVAHPSQLLYLPAIQEGSEILPIGTPIEVVSVTANILTVKAINK